MEEPVQRTDLRHLTMKRRIDFATATESIEGGLGDLGQTGGLADHERGAPGVGHETRSLHVGCSVEITKAIFGELQIGERPLRHRCELNQALGE